MENNENTSARRICFAAIDPFVEVNILSPKEKEVPSRNLVEWGDRNAYPDYLLELSKTAPTLRAVISGTVDFIVGDDVTVAPLPSTTYLPGIMNTRGDTIREQVRDIAADHETYGGFALQVIRSFAGNIVEVYYIDIRFLRSNKDNSVFYYSEKWGQSRRKVVEYPAFFPFTPESWNKLTPEERERHASSIVFVKNNHTQVYPLPVYCAAVKACETERCIDDYHLNAINNGFAPSVIMNFNNGVPADEIKEEIEKDVYEKYSGHQNAARIMLSWNDSKETATTVQTIKTDDFGEHYKALAGHVRQQIFTAFRANPNLFGIPTENLGFSQEEYESAFKLYNRTCVQPVQRLICDTYERIYGAPGVLAFSPFTLAETPKARKIE